jgi:hypothetical protein
MIIRDKIVLVYDLEVFPNVFSCTVRNTETGETLVFEVSNRKNHIEKIIQLFQNKQYLFCGYNNHHYDDPIINFIIDYKVAMSSASSAKICLNIFKLSDIIVNTDNTEAWKKWKYANNFASMDLLTMLFSQKLRVGLKEMEVTMQFHNVQEYEGNFNDWLPDSEIDKMLAYNLNDVDATEELLNRCEKEIKLRIGIQKEFGIDVLSKDGMTIGTEILKTKYLEKSGKSWWEIKDLRSPCDIIDLKDVIFPFIHYDTPLLKDFLEEFKQQKVGAGRKAYEKHFLLGNVEVSVGVGGIHTKNTPEIIIPNEDEILADSDVNSLYPSLIISYGLVPKHLGKEFLDIYGAVREDRLYAKHHPEIEGNDIKNSTYKLALNGATGNYQNEYSWLYDPIAVMKIRINGQLLLLMLTEKLIQAGAKIKQLNTDGVLYIIKKDVDLNSILHSWEEETKLSLETEEYEAFYQFAINDYLAIGKGYSESKNKKLLKYKGLFIPTVSLGKGMQPMIIPKALNAYFADGILPEETVHSCRNINDFITYQKVDKKFSVEYKGELVQHINRYYVSSAGDAGYLYKCEVDNQGTRYNYTNMLKGWGVKIVNNLDEINEFPQDINYRYYLSEIKKIINQFENQQLSLFNLWD